MKEGDVTLEMRFEDGNDVCIEIEGSLFRETIVKVVDEVIEGLDHQILRETRKRKIENDGCRMPRSDKGGDDFLTPRHELMQSNSLCIQEKTDDIVGFLQIDSIHVKIVDE